jgi:acetoin utilization deacetylase AcuC-like enzyme
MRQIGLVRDERFLAHRTGLHHIETPRRLEAIYSMLDTSGLSNACQAVPARYAGLDELSAVHNERYIEKILDTAGETLRYLDTDTVTSEQSCAAAFLAAGGCLEAVDAVVTGGLDAVFACVRPPGHHAERNRQMGFCLFNNVAVAAEYARRKHGMQRVLIVDWDVHHPNGTQHIFETSSNVLLFSTHRYPFFPGTGADTEIGFGEGQGYTINIPLSARRTDADFAYAFRTILIPVARSYAPELILVSAGFDAHRDDPIGGMFVSENGFALLADEIMRLAGECGSGAVFVLEGGYDLGALRLSVRTVLETMLSGLSAPLRTRYRSMPEPGVQVADAIESARCILKPYWECL